MLRKHKLFSKPKRPFEKERIQEEDNLKREFGLKNKKEIWRAESKVNSLREKAKKIIPFPEKQKEFFERLNKMGFNVETIGDVLSLDKRDFLERRLQSITYYKGLAKTMKEARQMVVHRKVIVDGQVVDSPSLLVSAELEDKITIKKKKVKPKKPEETTSEEVVEKPVEKEDAKEDSEENKSEEKQEKPADKPTEEKKEESGSEENKEETENKSEEEGDKE